MTDIQKVLKLYDDGMSITKISKATSMSIYKVRKTIVGSGREVRNHGYQGLNIDIDEVNALYESGLSTYDIARKFGCSDETIRRRIKSMRSESERNTRSKESKRKISKSCKAKWGDKEYRNKVCEATNTESYKSALSEAAKRSGTLAKRNKSQSGRKAISDRVKRLWENPQYFSKQSVYFAERGKKLQEAFKKRIEDPESRRAWISKIRANSISRRAKQPRISSTQAQLYYILENSSITYYEEGEDTKVGPFYVVDCIVPKQQNMERDLIIEVQGEYWHSLNNVKTRDAQKQTYVRRHTNFDLLHLEELDMKSWDEVCTKLFDYGLSLRTIDCRPKDLTVFSLSIILVSPCVAAYSDSVILNRFDLSHIVFL